MQWRHSRSEVFHPHISIPWSITEQTQAAYTLPHAVGERCPEVRTCNSFLNIPHATQHLAATVLSQPHQSTACHPDSRKWPPHQAWCYEHPLASLVSNQWGESLLYLEQMWFDSAITPLVDSSGQLTLRALCGVVANTRAADSAGIVAWFLEDIKVSTGDHELGLLRLDTGPLT